MGERELVEEKIFKTIRVVYVARRRMRGGGSRIGSAKTGGKKFNWVGKSECEWGRRKKFEKSTNRTARVKKGVGRGPRTKIHGEGNSGRKGQSRGGTLGRFRGLEKNPSGEKLVAKKDCQPGLKIHQLGSQRNLEKAWLGGSESEFERTIVGASSYV